MMNFHHTACLRSVILIVLTDNVQSLVLLRVGAREGGGGKNAQFWCSQCTHTHVVSVSPLILGNSKKCFVHCFSFLGIKKSVLMLSMHTHTCSQCFSPETRYATPRNALFVVFSFPGRVREIELGEEGTVCVTYYTLWLCIHSFPLRKF